MAYEKGITEERDKCKLPARADGEIAPYRIVVPGTEPEDVAQASTPTEYTVGISENASENGKASYEDGDPVTVAYGGIKYLEMSSIGDRGDRVMSDAEGKGVKHSSQDNVWIIGAATQAWTDGQIIPVEIIKQYISEVVGS